MDYFDIGDKINRADLNSLVYLLRKFKKLTTDLTIGSSTIETKYGTLNFTDGFKSIGNNWIIEDDVTITSNDALKNSFYTFNFTVFDRNLSGEVNYRTVSVTSDSTGDDGVLSVEIPTEAFGDGDIILGEYQMQIVFDEHEYYTPLTNYNVTLAVEKDRILMYEDNTIYLTLKQGATVVPYALTSILIEGKEFFATTDDNGVAEFIYTGKGAGRVTVTTSLDSTASVSFYDNPDYVTANFTGANVTLGSGGGAWLITDEPAIIDWGDGTTSRVDNPTTALTHTYTDNQSSHEVKFIGEITGLGVNCFKNCTNLQSVAIIEGITSIGDSCFYGCTSLSTVVLPNTVTVLNASCFRGCNHLTSITLPESVTSFGDSCFFECNLLANIDLPDSLTYIGVGCFYNCYSLTSIDLPDSLTSIKSVAFRKCSGLTSISIPDSVIYIETNTFYECSGLTSVTMTDSVTATGSGCFAYCTNLESIRLSNNITNLQNNTFLDCSELSSVNIPVNVQTIGASCFEGCSSLTSVTLPEKVTNIGEACFKSCTGLTGINIPESVQVLGNNCFNGCTGLLDYQLYWTGNEIIQYNNAHLQDNTNTKYTIPNNTFDLYENKNYPSAKLIERGYRLILSSSTDIVKNGDSTTITALLLNDGVASSSKTLNYTIKHSGTVISTGTKTTNSNGQATISYTGTGIGEVEIIVSYSTLAQKTYRIIDGTWVDTASAHNIKWWTTNPTGYNVTVQSDGILVEFTGSAYLNDYCYLTDNFPSGWSDRNNAVKCWTVPFIIEFDLISMSSSSNIGIYLNNDSVTVNKYLSDCNITGNGHVKIVADGSTLKTYLNGNLTSTNNYSLTGDSRFGFRVNSGNSLKYNNFVIYPQNTGKSLSINANKTSMYIDESVVISGVLLNDGVPVSSASVTVYQGSTSLGTVTTNSNGEYSKTINGLSAGSYTFKTTHDNIESHTVGLSVYNHTYALSASADKSTMYADESVTITGVLTKDSLAWANQTITIYDGSTSKGTVTTNTNGAYTKTISGLSDGSHTLKAQHTNATSSNVSLTVNNHSYSLTASASKSTLYTDESTVISGVLKKDNVVWAGQQVKIYDGSTLIDTVTTNSNGAYTKTVTGLSAGSHTLKAQHTNATSSNVSITVNTHTYSLTASASKTTIYNDESVTLTGTLKRDNTVFANQSVTIYQGSTSLGTVTTNNNGVYSKTISGLSVGAYTFKASYSGTNSNTVTITVNNHTYNITASTDKSTLYTDESVTVGGVLTKDSNVYANQTVTIYDGSTSKGTATTNSSGVYSKVLTGLSAGSHTLKVGYSSVYSSNMSVTVNNHSYALTCTLDKVSMDADETVTITGNLKKDNSNWANQTVNIYDGSNIIATVSTNSSGNYSKAVTGLSTGSHSIRAVHNLVQSSNVGLTVNAYNIGISASSTSIYTDGSVVISGTLSKNGSVWSGQTVTVYDGSTSKGTTTTDSNGKYSMTLSSLSVGVHAFKATHTKVESSTVNVSVTNHIYSLTADATYKTISYGNNTRLYGYLKKDGNAWANQTVQLYDGSTNIGTGTTDSNGLYSESIAGLSAGSHTLKAQNSYATSGNVYVTVNDVYSLTAGLSASTIYIDGSVTVSGVLKKNNAVWSGQTITIYDGTTSKGTVTTDANGAYSKTLSSLSAGTHTLKASHTNTSSGNVSLTVRNHSYSLTASASKSSIYTDETVTVSGVLKKDNTAWASQTITVYDGSTSKGTATTNNSGAYSKAVSGLSAGTHTLKAQHTNATSGNMSVTVKNHSYNLTCTASSGSINYGQSVTISGALKKDGANWSGQTITIKDGNTVLGSATTDSNGAYSKSISGLGAGSHSIKAYHTNTSSGTTTVTVKATEKIIATFTGSSITMGNSMEETAWLISNGDATIDWGDGTTSTVNNRISPLSHTFTNGSGSHTVKFSGNITGIGDNAFSPDNWDNPELTSIEIKDGVTSIGNTAFYKCVNLASVIIPSTVTSIARRCFDGCGSLAEYNLYWTTSSKIIAYDSSKMPITSNGKFKIPRGTTSLYTSKGYPSAKLQERS